VIDACTDIAYNVTAPAAGGIVSSRCVYCINLVRCMNTISLQCVNNHSVAHEYGIF